MDTDGARLSPENAIFQLANGYWASALLAAGTTHSLFTHIDRGMQTVESIAEAAGLSMRGAQALLDGLVGLGLLTVNDGRYANSAAASQHLVDGKPMSLVGIGRTIADGMRLWSKLPEAVKTGIPPTTERVETPDHPFWEELVTAIAPTSAPLARRVVERLDAARRGPLAILDVGGGSGIYSAVLLGANREATATQVDWANVNRVARAFVARFGVADRFKTIDGNLHETSFGEARFDIAIFSHVAHHDSPESNVATFRKLRAALRPGGTLVVSDLILNDDRTGSPLALMFHAKMLLYTASGGAWRRADYRSWLEQAGFKDVVIEPTQTPATLIFAT
ncbi:uncharacterized protein SOCE836_026600 [Sorangium cellulosum]|uniref:SAM-dependent methyltransferase n=1 Tax=Sorangium cellulosum TaxID=56 RepID=A0A3Q8I2K0_SORCE|nr:uncharacterized protein SOCE836_026600 [Sorangium cellulosum]AYM53032.1 hypothetical protein [Sorangium cellulosum]WCQ89946.1 3-hydroxy-5-methyl-1-naphthoate 3-O-methyltransferase [Sorangium sp. Soce836]